EGQDGQHRQGEPEDRWPIRRRLGEQRCSADKERREHRLYPLSKRDAKDGTTPSASPGGNSRTRTLRYRACRICVYDSLFAEGRFGFKQFRQDNVLMFRYARKGMNCLASLLRFFAPLREMVARKDVKNRIGRLARFRRRSIRLVTEGLHGSVKDKVVYRL